MSEIKFACPTCAQSISAPPEYAGMEIDCPGCRTAIIVPAPEAPIGAKRGTSLTKAPSTVEHAATTPAMAATIVRKNKKPRIGLYVGLGVGVAAVVAVIILLPKLSEKYQEHKDAAAAQIAATNAPPPPPPDLKADEIVKKMGEAYKAYTSYSAQGVSVADMDLSAVNAALKDPVHSSATDSILLGRPSLYRLEWEKEQKVGAKTVKAKGEAWSAGKGDFVRAGSSPTTMKNRDTALGAAGNYSGTLGAIIAALFFEDVNGVTGDLKGLAKTNNETLDGYKCYVLTGEFKGQRLEIWVHKEGFEVARLVVHVGGKPDEAIMAKLPIAQRMQMEKLAKIKGTITETYSNIETNQSLSPDVFQKPIVPGTAPVRARPARGPGTLDRARQPQ